MYREEKKKHKKIFYHCSTLNMASAKANQNQELAASSGSATMVQCPSYTLLLSQAIARELDRAWSKQDTKCHPYGMMALANGR